MKALYNGCGQLMTNEGNFEELGEFKYLGTTITNRNEMHKEIKHRLISGNIFKSQELTIYIHTQGVNDIDCQKKNQLKDI